MTSAKNRLQEYCQKQNFQLPHYERYSEGPLPHQLLWFSTVSLIDQGLSFKSQSCNSKVAADTDAAEKALQYLDKTMQEDACQETTNMNLDGVVDTVILVDVENMPNFLRELEQRRLLSHYRVFGFIGLHHPLAQRSVSSDVTMIISPSTRPDGSDTCMQIFAGVLLTQGHYRNYIVVTRDHFGSCLVEMISSGCGNWTPQSARLVTHIDQL